VTCREGAPTVCAPLGTALCVRDESRPAVGMRGGRSICACRRRSKRNVRRDGTRGEVHY
jgi:hypothetical protein